MPAVATDVAEMSLFSNEVLKHDDRTFALGKDFL